jgi:lipopolysaccharide O-acetyltransferase
MYKIIRKIKNDGVLWGLFNIFLNVKIMLRNIFARHSLNAKNIYLGGIPVIRGAKHIDFGDNIRVGGAIWIEAINAHADFCYSPKIKIGKGTSFSDGVHITAIDRIEIGCNVLMGSRVFISDHGHGIYKGQGQSSPHEPPTERKLGGAGIVIIEDNVWIGDNVIIVGPVVIKRGAVIGANSVVKHDVPENSIVAGIPAKIIKEYDETKMNWNIA